MRKAYYKARTWLLLAGMLVGSPWFLFLIRRRERSSKPDTPLHILVIPQLTRIGDLVCATPVFKAIKEQYPDSFLAVLATRKVAGIIKHNSRIDEIITYRTSHFMSVLKTIRARHFDWSFCLSGTAIGTMVAVYGLIPHRVKLTRRGRPVGELVSDWLNSACYRYEHHTYLPGHYLRMLRSIGIVNPAEVKEVFMTHAHDQTVGAFLKQSGIAGHAFLVGISITGGNRIKEWGDENFKKLTEYLVERHRATVIFIGAKGDEGRIDALLRECRGEERMRGSFFKAVDFSLEELPSLIKRLTLYIACDTGPLYIAHALGVPLIDIVGPVDPREQPPEDERSIPVRPDGPSVPSSFVMKRPGSAGEHRKALERTPVEKVAAAVDALKAWHII